MGRAHLVMLSAAGIITMTACTDYPTDGTVPLIRKGVTVVPSRTTSYACSTIEKAPGGGYRHEDIWIRFPKKLQAADGSRMLYKLHVTSNSGEILAAANCRIPKTEAALAAMNRRLAETLKKVPGSKRVALESAGLPPGKPPTPDAPGRIPVLAILALPPKNPRYDLPTVYITAIYTAWPGWGSWGSNCDWDCNEQPSNGGNQTWTPDPDLGLPPCDPLDTQCERALTYQDVQVITIALDQHLKALASIPDSVASTYFHK